MKTLEEVVEETVNDFVANDILFTALDVSNKVKEELPLARHRQVRDIVRQLYLSSMPANYAKTPIQVSLEDGTSVEAILYHPLSDSWDLDNKYDSQKRSQKAVKAKAINSPPNLGATVASDGTITLTAPTANVVSPTIAAAAPTNSGQARQLWQQLFASQPSLFPRR